MTKAYLPLTQSGMDIFSALSIICVLFTLSIPLLYIFRHRHQSYGMVSQREESDIDVGAAGTIESS